MPANPSIDEHIKLVTTLAAEGLTAPDIIERTGFKKSNVYRYLKLAGITAKKPKKDPSTRGFDYAWNPNPDPKVAAFWEKWDRRHRAPKPREAQPAP